MAIKNLSEIEQRLGLKAGEFTTLLSAPEEHEINLADIEIIRKADLNTRIENIKSEAKAAELEIQIKEAKKKYGLEFEGKSIDKFAEAYKKKVATEVGGEPNKRIQELESDFGTLKSNYEKEIAERKRIETEFTQKENKRKINETILGKLTADTIIPKDKLLTIFHSEFETELTDSGIVFKKGGNVLKNQTTLSPLSPDEVLADFVKDYAKPVSGGAGGKDNPAPSKVGSFDAFIKEMETKEIKQGTEAFNREMQKRIKDKTLTL